MTTEMTIFVSLFVVVGIGAVLMGIALWETCDKLDGANDQIADLLVENAKLKQELNNRI